MRPDFVLPFSAKKATIDTFSEYGSSRQISVRHRAQRWIDGRHRIRERAVVAKAL
jgi:hypothetical protein